MGSKLYGVLFYCFPGAAFLGFLLQFYLTNFIGFQGLFWILGGASGGTIGIVFMFKEERLWGGPTRVLTEFGDINPEGKVID